MNQLIALLTAQLGEKGANKKRNLTVLALLWIAWTLHGVDKRVAAVEARLGIVTQAIAPFPLSTNTAAAWPEHPGNVSASLTTAR